MSMKISVLTYEDISDISFVPPAQFFIKNAMSEYVYIHTRSRAKAQEWVDNTYGKGKYRIVSSKSA